MTIKKFFSLILKVLGFLFISTALLGAWGAVNAYIERAQHGAGIMFADAEIFVLLALVFSVLGFVCLWIGKKLKT
jgi:hypothetical protein